MITKLKIIYKWDFSKLPPINFGAVLYCDFWHFHHCYITFTQRKRSKTYSNRAIKLFDNNSDINSFIICFCLNMNSNNTFEINLGFKLTNKNIFT